MKTRVLSVRLPYNTIAYCYKLQEIAGGQLQGRPLGTVVSGTVEALIEASRKLYKLPEMSEEESKSYIQGFILELPGFEAGDVVGQLRSAQAWKEEKHETRPAEASVATEPVQTEQGESALTKALAVLCPSIGSAPGLVSIEAATQAELIKDEQALIEKVSAGSVTRVTPDAPEQAPKCPWDGVTALSEEAVKDDILYQEAMAKNELFGLAARVVYAVLPKTKWSTDKAVELVNKTYKDFKSWKEKYGTV